MLSITKSMVLSTSTIYFYNCLPWWMRREMCQNGNNSHSSNKLEKEIAIWKFCSQVSIMVIEIKKASTSSYQTS